MRCALIVLAAAACGRSGFDFADEPLQSGVVDPAVDTGVSGGGTGNTPLPPDPAVDTGAIGGGTGNTPPPPPVLCGIPSDERVFGAPEEMLDVRGLIEGSMPTRFGLRFDPTFSSDGLALYFISDQTGWEIWRVTRPSLQAPFDTIEVLGPDANQASQSESNFHFREDLGVATVISDFGSGQGLYEGRVETDGSFQWSFSLLNSGLSVGDSRMGADGLVLYFTSVESMPGIRDIFRAERESLDVSFGEPVRMDELSVTGIDDSAPAFAADGYALLMVTERTEGLGNDDIWLAERSSLDQPFDAPTPLVTVNSATFDGEPELFYNGGDHCELVFVSSRGADLFQLFRSIITR